ncbi:WW domain binding protein 1-like a [Pygocentrus nattereri]|uniref:WW domain binding protein 1-like b n=1 Tax=Pygocentrus nattereri TaxID=42514 RepID=A0AAR2JFR1_PYGNA|nr:WW domain binding protein 1-like a [Pygocentrus nattereri]
MSYRAADVSTATTKRGMWETDYTALKMGLFFMNAVVGPVSSASAETLITESKLLCIGVNNQSYICESGHCCGESQCCSYYYELWWFWLVWTVIIILSCCCVCHHRRTKHRLQQQQRQHEINLIAYREVHNYTSLPFYFRFLPSYLLPAYEEVENRPSTPPPPYSASQPGQGSDAMSPEQPDELCPSLQSTPTNPASESHSSRDCIEETHCPDTHCPAGDAHKPYLSFEEDGQQQQVASATSPEMSKQGSCRKDPSKPVEQGLDSCPDNKDRTPGRHRRFTGDSGIEVCVCNRGPGEDEEEEEEMKELEGLLDREGLREQDFCDSCNPRNNGPQQPGDEEQGFAAPERGPEHREPPLQRPPICLHLHTINEQEGPHHGNNTDPQS